MKLKALSWVRQRVLDPRVPLTPCVIYWRLGKLTVTSTVNLNIFAAKSSRNEMSNSNYF